MSMRMRKIIEQILKKNGLTFEDLKKLEYIKIKNKPFMDLNIDYLGKFCGLDRFAVAHNFLQMGDVMADPDMEFLDDKEKFYPATFQNDAIGVFQRAINCTEEDEIIKNPSLVRSLTTFANQWAKNLKNQGFIEGECKTVDKKDCKEALEEKKEE